MTRGLFVASAIALFGACAATPDPSTPTASPDDALGKQLQGNGQGPDVNPNAPVSSGECQFKSGTQCFTTADAACKAAGCEMPSCKQLETFPVQVQCKK